MRYKLIPKEVDAIQIKRDIKSIAKVYFFVGWMMKTGLGYDSGMEGQKKWLDKANAMLEYDCVMLPINGGAFEQVSWGDYIIRSEDMGGSDYFTVMSSGNFESTYEVIKQEEL